jgi:hypothetical protein
MKVCIHITTCFHQVKVFSKLTNIHLYINQNKTKQKNNLIYTSSHVSPYDLTYTLIWKKKFT